MTLANARFDPESIHTYHAHVYYSGPEQRAIAAEIREAAHARFEVQLGRWREEPVGPHPLPMYQIAFDVSQFTRLVPWLMSMRQSLSILVHARTGLSDVMDHTAGAMWLGKSLDLNLEFFDIDGKSA